MWRLFRWLDRHPPDFHKFTLIVFGLAMIVMTGYALGHLHPAAGIVFVYATLFALLRASHVYRFTKKEPEPSPRDQPISEASDREILRRVRRGARTEFWRRQILAAKDEPGKRGDLARSIIKRWEDAEAAKAARDKKEPS